MIVDAALFKAWPFFFLMYILPATQWADDRYQQRRTGRSRDSTTCSQRKPSRNYSKEYRLITRAISAIERLRAIRA